MLRDHNPVTRDEFNGLWNRGEADSVPSDHFSDCNNLQFVHSGFRTRDGLDTYIPIRQIVRIYTYVQQTGESLLGLDLSGNIYHSSSPTPFVPILFIPGMTDFGFVSINGRAFITPFDITTGIGLQNEWIYIYKGDGTPARRMGGAPPTGVLSLAEGAAGDVEPGVHVLGVAYETDTGFITQLAGFAQITATGGLSIDVTNIPINPDPFVVARRLVATYGIDPTDFTGDLTGYQFFFIPGGRIADNTTTSLNVSFFDAALLVDASHLQDLFVNVHAATGLTTFHNRLVTYCEHDNISLARVSLPGEPEAINAVDGLLIIPLDGNPLTNAQEFRDVLYMFKATRTIAYNDNGDVPSSWPYVIMDQGIGASVHGIATVLDSGGVNIDFLIIVDYSGLMLFNGSYIRPELSWKIRDFWFGLDRDAFRNIQIVNDSLQQFLWITLPDQKMLHADYSNGLNSKDIRFCPESFDIQTNTITLFDKNKLVIGSPGASV